MPVGKQPAFQFYPGDWFKDPELSRVSPAARGVWMDMLCLMWESEDRGRLISGGKPWTKEDIVKAVRGDPKGVLQNVTELVDAHVTEQDPSGAYICRRMVRDQKARLKGGERVRKHRSNANVTVVKRKCNTPSSSSSSSSNQPPAGAGLGADSDPEKTARLEALKQAGIAAHNRDAIADHPECSVSLIREVSGSVAARGGEAGVIVIELRERLERLATHTRERQRTDKALDDARRERRSEIGLAEERRLRGIERIKAMTPESHRRCYDAAMQRLGPNYTTREGWNSDPLTNQVLRANMLHVDHTLRDSGEHGEPNQPDDGPELKYPGTGDSDG